MRCTEHRFTSLQEQRPREPALLRVAARYENGAVPLAAKSAEIIAWSPRP
jgi:hypothetical protein